MEMGTYCTYSMESLSSNDLTQKSQGDNLNDGR